MKSNLIIGLFFVFSSIFAQEDAWIYFKDKPASAIYFSNPLQMLTQRSLDRRLAQNIALDLNDVPIEPTYINQIALSNGVTIMAKSKWLNCLHVRGTIADINALQNFSFVSNVKFANKNLNTNNRLAVRNSNKIVYDSDETHATFNYGLSNNQITMLNGQILHQQNFTGAGKIIAVLDAGFPNVSSILPFDRLRNNNLILGGYNFVDRSNNFYSQDSHGTLVLSTMGGFSDNALVGSAPDAAYYLFITENAASENPVEESFWVEAAEEADRLGVDIINSSLGYFGYDNPNYSYSYSDMTGDKTFVSKGANIAFTRGIIVVVSAGNSGATPNPYIGSPADATNVLTVGAVDSQKNRATFSSIGPNFSGQVKPDVLAKGVSSTVAIPSGAISAANGTSFSSPIMAGMVACLWQALPNKTAKELMQIIKMSSDNFETPNATRGYGIPDFAAALNSNLTITSKIKDNYLPYPNPSSNSIIFTVPERNSKASIEIFNLVGQIIYSQNITSNKHFVEIGDFSNGLYFYHIKNGMETFEGKFLKY